MSKKQNVKQELMNSQEPLRNHKPVTRRDFIAQGYISSLGFVMAPNVLSMLASANAFAACPSAATAGATRKTPVIIFDLAGGANLAGSDVVVGKAGGQLDFLSAGKYQSLGLPPDQEPRMAGKARTINGAALGGGLAFQADSDLLRGMMNVAGAALNNVDGIVYAAASGDDTSNNPHNPSYWLQRAGATGSLVQIVGSNNSDSGGNAVAPGPSYNPGLRSVQVANANQARGLIQLGALGNLFLANGVTNNAKVKKILEAAEMTSSRKIASFNSLDLSDQIKELVNCGFLDSKDLVGKFSQQAVDPATDVDAQAAFPQMAANGDQARTASVAKLVLEGYAGVGTVVIGGCDYHGNGRENQSLKNQTIGSLIGGAIMMADRKDQDLMIIVYSDGGVSADTTVNTGVNALGRFNFVSDSGSRSSAIQMLYKKDGVAQLTDGVRQVGAFSVSAGAVDRAASQISDNVQNLSKAFVANYLALHGEEGKLAQVVGQESLSSELGKYVKFRKIR